MFFSSFFKNDISQLNFAQFFNFSSEFIVLKIFKYFFQKRNKNTDSEIEVDLFFFVFLEYTDNSADSVWLTGPGLDLNHKHYCPSFGFLHWFLFVCLHCCIVIR